MWTTGSEMSHVQNTERLQEEREPERTQNKPNVVQYIPLRQEGLIEA